jgi:lipopolysaccharide transport system ATP-binding protein
MHRIIQVEGLGKKYQIGATRAKYLSLREELGKLASRLTSRTLSRSEEFWALRDVTFSVGEGEVVGIIGRNGAGKSTLLKILSRITPPTEGKITCRGRIASLLEVGTGFHPELTGRENIFLNGTILGMTRHEIKRKFDEIVAFAEVDQFLDTPVKRYSSGMFVRLAFAVAAHLEPEVLIVDEVLAVGDAEFQAKCLGKMGDVAHAGRTVLFVSHNMTSVLTLCNRSILLSHGTIMMDGATGEVVEQYLARSLGAHEGTVTFKDESFRRIQFLEATLRACESARGEELVELTCKYIVRKPANGVLLCVEVRNSSDVSVFYSNDSTLEDNRKRLIGIHTATLTIPAYLLAPGGYLVSLGFWKPGHEAEHFPTVRLPFRRDEPTTVLSAHGIAWPSVIYMPASWTYAGQDSRAVGNEAAARTDAMVI